MKKFLPNKLFISVLYLFFCSLIVVWMNGLISRTPVTGDALQNLRMAYHLYNNGVLSNAGESTESPLPTNYREPLPPVVSAIFMALHPGIDRQASLKSFEEGINTARVKQVNLLWILLLLIGLGYLTYILTGSRVLPFMVLLLVPTYFIRFGGHFDVLNTELHAAVLMTGATLLLVFTVRKRTPALYFSTGLCIGLLILTKAIFFYVSILVALFLLWTAGPGRKLSNPGLFVAGFLLIVGPWMIRNHLLLDDFEITPRAGAVLHLRATQNQMNGEEMIGAMYFWGPAIYHRAVKNSILDADDLDFELGGKYERLNPAHEVDTLAVESGRPNDAVAFFNKSRAEINRLQKMLGSGGREGPRSKVYKMMKSQSLEMIRNHPLKHVSMTVLFMWRGMWCFPNSTLPFVNEDLQKYLHNTVNFFSYFSLFGLFMTGFLKRNTIFIALTILPVGMLLFHAFLTQNIPRFSEPAIPFMLVSFSLILYYLVHPLFIKTDS